VCRLPNSYPTLQSQIWYTQSDRADIYDAFGDSSSKTNQEHLDTICALAANIAEAQTYYPVVSAV
jgi:glucan 1,3-beta-glucosidase